MDAFDRYGEDLIEAGRRRRLGLPRRPGRNLRRTVALAVLIALILAAAALGAALLLGSNDGSARLLARARRLATHSLACRVHRDPGVLTHDHQPLAGTRVMLGILAHAQTSTERDFLAEYFTKARLRALPGTAILASSLRIVSTSGGSSLAVVIVRHSGEGAMTLASGCIQRELAILPSLATHSSPKALAHAKLILNYELQRHATTQRAVRDEIYAVFRNAHGQSQTRTIGAESFTAAGLFSRTRYEVQALLPTEVASVELLGRGLPRSPVVLPISENTVSAAFPRGFDHPLVMMWRDARGRVLSRHSVNR
jgi:hypothetical protein